MNEVSEVSVCGVKDCENPIHARGICLAHFNAINLQVEAGQAKWKQFEDAGICTPIRNMRQPPSRGCMTESCPRNSRARGLCDDCYAAAVRFKNANDHQWYDLEQMGLTRPARKRLTSKQSAFMNKAKKAQAEAMAKLGISYASPTIVETEIPVTQSEPLAPQVQNGHANFYPTAPSPPETVGPPPFIPSDLPPVSQEMMKDLESRDIATELKEASKQPSAPLSPSPLPLSVPLSSVGQPEAVGQPPAPSIPTPEELAVINAPAPEATPEEPKETEKSLTVSLPFDPYGGVEPAQFPGSEGGVQ